MEKLDALRIMQIEENNLSEENILNAYSRLKGTIGEDILNEAKKTLSLSLLSELKAKDERLNAQKEVANRRVNQIEEQLSKYMEIIKKLQAEQEKINNNLPNYDTAISRNKNRISELENDNRLIVEETKKKDLLERKENIINNKRGLQKNADEIFRQLDPNRPDYNDLRKQYDSINNLIIDYDRELKEIEEEEERKNNNNIEKVKEIEESVIPTLEDKSLNINFDYSKDDIEEYVEPKKEIIDVESKDVVELPQKEEIDNALSKEEKVEEQLSPKHFEDFDITGLEGNIEKESDKIINGLNSINFDDNNEVTFNEHTNNDIPLANEATNNTNYYEIIGGHILQYPSDVKEEIEEPKKELSSSGIMTKKSSAENLSNQEISNEKYNVVTKPLGLLGKLKYKLNKKNIEKAKEILHKEINKINYDYLRINKLKEIMNNQNINEMQKQEYQKLIDKLYVGKDFDAKFINTNIEKLANIDPDIKDSILDEIVSSLPNNIEEYDVNSEIVDNLYISTGANNNYTEEDINSFEELVANINDRRNILSNHNGISR